MLSSGRWPASIASSVHITDKEGKFLIVQLLVLIQSFTLVTQASDQSLLERLRIAKRMVD